MPRQMGIAAIHPDVSARWLAAGPGGSWAAGDGHTVTVRDARGAEQLRAVSPGELVFGMAFAPAGDLLVAAPRLLDLATGDWRDRGDVVGAVAGDLGIDAVRGFAVHDAAVSADTSRMIVRAEYRPPRTGAAGVGPGTPTMRLAALDPRTLRDVTVLWEGQGATISALAVHADRAAAAWTDVDVWSADGTPLARVPGTGPAVRSLAFSADGLLLAAGYADGAVRVVRPGDGAGERVPVGTGHVAAVAVTPDGGHVLAGTEDGRVTLLSADGAVKATGDAGGRVTAIAVRPDGSRALVGRATPVGGVVELALS